MSFFPPFHAFVSSNDNPIIALAATWWGKFAFTDNKKRAHLDGGLAFASFSAQVTGRNSPS
jgi:hypothetical protein